MPYLTFCDKMRKILILEIDREQGNKEKTRLTYNCAHVRSTKESVTFRYTEEGKYISFAEKRKTKRKLEEIFVWGRIRKKRKIPGIGRYLIGLIII